LTSAREADILKIRKTPRSQAPAPKGLKNLKGQEEHTLRNTVKAHVDEDRSGSRLTYAKKEERSKESSNGGREIGGRGKLRKAGLGGRVGG